MDKREKMLEYLREKYDPSAIIVYGSFANGTNDEHSDFDALVITDHSDVSHDDSIVDGTELDVFLYSPEHFNGKYDSTEIEQIYDGCVFLDKDGLGEKLIREAAEKAESNHPKTIEEKEQAVSWCKKMLQRIEREDPEGFFRWHWLLTDSLEIYCDIKDYRYVGPKKGLAFLSKSDETAYKLYSQALESFTIPALKKWITYLETCLN